MAHLLSFWSIPDIFQDLLFSQVVSNPMDFIKVQQKIKTDEYEDVDSMVADVELMVNNAKAFYKV